MDRGAAYATGPVVALSVDELSVRFAEVDLKRRRAEALAEGLATRVAQLEGAARAGGARLDDRAAELQQKLASLEEELGAAHRALAASETARLDLEQSASEAWSRAERAEQSLGQLREEHARIDAMNTEAQRAFAMRIGELDRALAVERERTRSAGARAASLADELTKLRSKLDAAAAAADEGSPLPEGELKQVSPHKTTRRSIPTVRRSSPSASRPDLAPPRGAFSAADSSEISLDDAREADEADELGEPEGPALELFIDD